MQGVPGALRRGAGRAAGAAARLGFALAPALPRLCTRMRAGERRGRLFISYLLRSAPLGAGSHQLCVALVVVALNRARIHADTLWAASAQTRSPDRIFVVDNGSTDETSDMLARDFAEVEILKSGHNVGVNAGLAICLPLK